MAGQDTTTVAAAETTTQVCVIPNFGPGELNRVLRLFEELAMTLMWWERDAQGEDGDGWRPPAVCSGAALNEVHTRLWETLRHTQTRQEMQGNNRVDVEPDGPEWRTTSGYDLANLYFVELRTADLQALGAFAAALADPKLDSGVQEAVDDVNEREVDQHGESWSKQEERRRNHGAAAAVAQLHALLTVTPEPGDLALLQAALAAAGDRSGVRLDSTAEAAWHRVVDACTQALIAGTALDRHLTRWALGSRDHS